MSDKKKEESIVTYFYTLLQLFGWSFIFCYLCVYTYSGFKASFLIMIIPFIRIFQSLQILDIIFAVLKITKANAAASFVQVVARLINLFWLYDNVTPSHIVLLTFFPWALSEIVRSLFYLHKDSDFIKTLRYNAFIILYPTGVLGEVLALDNYKDHHPDYFNLIRFVQVLMVIGLYFLYTYLFKQRRNYYKQQLTKTEKTN